MCIRDRHEEWETLNVTSVFMSWPHLADDITLFTNNKGQLQCTTVECADVINDRGMRMNIGKI